MTNVTCGLTAKKPGSAPCPINSRDRVWDYLTYRLCSTRSWQLRLTQQWWNLHHGILFIFIWAIFACLCRKKHIRFSCGGAENAEHEDARHKNEGSDCKTWKFNTFCISVNPFALSFKEAGVRSMALKQFFLYGVDASFGVNRENGPHLWKTFVIFFFTRCDSLVNYV